MSEDNMNLDDILNDDEEDGLTEDELAADAAAAESRAERGVTKEEDEAALAAEVEGYDANGSPTVELPEAAGEVTQTRATQKPYDPRKFRSFDSRLEDLRAKRAERKARIEAEQAANPQTPEDDCA
jgi:hypothetical protein